MGWITIAAPHGTATPVRLVRATVLDSLCQVSAAFKLGSIKPKDKAFALAQTLWYIFGYRRKKYETKICVDKNICRCWIINNRSSFINNLVKTTEGKAIKMLSPMNYGSAWEILINLQDCAAKSIKAQSCHADQSALRRTVNYVAVVRASHGNAGCAVLLVPL